MGKLDSSLDNSPVMMFIVIKVHEGDRKFFPSNDNVILFLNESSLIFIEFEQIFINGPKPSSLVMPKQATTIPAAFPDGDNIQMFNTQGFPFYPSMACHNVKNSFG